MSTGKHVVVGMAAAVVILAVSQVFDVSGWLEGRSDSEAWTVLPWLLVALFWVGMVALLVRRRR